ncbi:MAG: YafY family transcriptional regulator [Clostridiales bacterium]|jgi:predicted DNA-binding transcriptional regulator YafY|nr:YafY family transcriptional regulator [Clostridiales bacterium]
MQVNRLFEIIYILLSKKTVTARELAERFGCSTRTIYRDIDVLSLSGIPVYTEKGKSGGISLLPDYVLDKSVLDENEQAEILAALQGLITVRTDKTTNVLQKLSGIFNKHTVSWVEVDFSDWSYANGQDFNDFKTAILEKRVAEFDYYSSFGEKTFRRAEPLQLWFKDKAWYLKAYCLTRRDVRVFKLSRMRNIVISDERFIERDLLNSRAVNTNNARIEGEVSLTLKIAPEMAYRVLDEMGGCDVFRAEDGSFIVNAVWPEDEWVYGTILSFGDSLEVLAPERVRDIIREKAVNILKKYD